jgi:hypothetical protein
MSLDGIWLPLAVKIIATAILVISALSAAERSGPFWGALIVALPVSAGPTYVILAIDHDAHFLAESAIHSLAANAAIGLFLVAYTRLGVRHGGAVSLGGALAVWLAAALIIFSMRWTVATAAVLNLAIFGAGVSTTRNLAHMPGPAAANGNRWHEIPLRGLLVGLLVASVTTVSYLIGPKATGILAMFPVALASLAIIMHPRFGGPAVVPVMASSLRTVPSLACGLLVIALTAERWGKAASLAAALVAALTWAGGLILVRARRSALLSRPSEA